MKRALVLATATGLLASTSMAQVVEVFNTDFESGLLPEISGVASLEGVQGFAGLGHAGNTFGGVFLRNTAVNSATVVTLTDLPTHESISIAFLLAALDSWDSTNGSVSPDYFNVRVDGVLIFQTTFAHASGNINYNPPDGGVIAPKASYGFGGYVDSGYDMSYEPSLQLIPHTAGTVVIEFIANGAGYQGGSDESFAIDNLSVSVTVPSAGVLPVLAGAGLIGLRRRR